MEVEDLIVIKKLSCAVMLILPLMMAGPLSAQINDGIVPSGNIELLPTERPIVAYAMAGGFIIAALGIGFMASKRTNSGGNS